MTKLDIFSAACEACPTCARSTPRVLLAVPPDATMASPMDHQVLSRPRIGVPWRTAAEEAANRRVKSTNICMPWKEQAAKPCFSRSLQAPISSKREAENLDAFLLTGSPADIDPAHYGAKRHPGRRRCRRRSRAHRFRSARTRAAAGKPVLADLLRHSVTERFSGRQPVQDIPTELGKKICHSPEEDELPDGSETPDAMHGASLDPGRVLTLSGEFRRKSTPGITSPCWSRGAACALPRARRMASSKRSSGRTIRTGLWACSGIRKECRRMLWRRPFSRIGNSRPAGAEPRSNKRACACGL